MTQHDDTRHAEKLRGFGWGIFFIWIGAAFLASFSWGIGLLGVGVIALGGQIARRYLGYPVESFGLITGVGLIVWGACDFLKIELGGAVLPALSIALGILMLVAALRSRATAQ